MSRRGGRENASLTEFETDIWFDEYPFPFTHKFSSGSVECKTVDPKENFSAEAVALQMSEDVVVFRFRKAHFGVNAWISLVLDFASQAALAIEHFVCRPRGRTIQFRLLRGSLLGSYTYSSLSAFPVLEPDKCAVELVIANDPPTSQFADLGGAGRLYQWRSMPNDMQKHGNSRAIGRLFGIDDDCSVLPWSQGGEGGVLFLRTPTANAIGWKYDMNAQGVIEPTPISGLLLP